MNATTTNPHDGHILKILIAEDDPVSAHAAKQILEKNGCQVIICTSGEESLKNIDSSYDLLMLDLGLPGMDGFAVATAIRQRKDDVSTLPIIALTSTPEPDLVTRARQIGINGFLTKPFSPNKCKMLLDQYKCQHGSLKP